MKRRNLNFRETGSERSANISYGNRAKSIKEKFKLIFKKYGKN